MNVRSLPLTNLRRNPGRTLALSLLTAFLGFSLFGGTMVVGSLRAGLSSLESRLGADIMVLPSSAQSKVSFQNMLLTGTTGAFYMSRENLTRTLEVEGVEKAAAQVFLASLKADCCSIKIQVIGFDPETDFIVQPWMEKSSVKELGELDVVVGTDVGADVGEILRVYDQRCHVAGRLAETGTGLDSAVYCTMPTMRLLLAAAEEKGISHKITSDDDDVISAIYVKVREGYDIGKVNSTIQGHTRGASAVRTKSMITDVSSSLAGVSRAVTALIAAVWVLSLLLLLVAFAMISRERQREFALLRLLGASPRILAGIVRSEAALCCLLGGSLGVGLAALLLLPFTTLIETALGLPYLTPSPGKVLGCALLALFTTVAAGMLSVTVFARRLSRLDPGTVLREG